MPYVDASSQTKWAGLTKDPDVRPEILYTVPDTTTPPYEMITESKQSLELPQRLHPATASQLPRRQDQPAPVRRVSMPEAPDVEIAPSPPPTKAILSPVPVNNRLHAGHTPGPLSPKEGEEAGPSQTDLAHEPLSDKTPEQEDQSYMPGGDRELSGALSLPSLPKNPLVDGATEHIALEALDERLSQLAQEQERFSRLRGSPELPSAGSSSEDKVQDPHCQASSSNIQGAQPPAPAPAQDNLPTDNVPTNPTATQASQDASIYDTRVEIPGIKLKKPPMNFGAPIGQRPPPG